MLYSQSYKRMLEQWKLCCKETHLKVPKQSLQRHRNQDRCTEKQPSKLTPVQSILHSKIQICSQLPRGMQRICRPFVLMTILPYLERLFLQWHLDHFTIFIHICTLLFILYILLSTFIRFSHVFTLHLYLSLMRNIFLISDDAWISENLDFKRF